jgi:uncharacterized membrane protein
MKTHLEHFLDVLGPSFWFVPATFAAAAVALAFALVWMDSTVSTYHLELLGWLCASDAEGARQLLVVIGGSMVTVAGMAFSITVVALSMACPRSSGQSCCAITCALVVIRSCAGHGYRRLSLLPHGAEVCTKRRYGPLRTVSRG